MGGNPGSALVSLASFSILLATPPHLLYVAPEAKPTTECPGEVDNPEAASGFACFYTGEIGSGAVVFVLNAYTSGAEIEIGSEGLEAYAFGAFAVTGN